MTAPIYSDPGRGPYLAPFKRDGALGLYPAPNGGWVVYGKADSPGERDEMLGAFSKAEDMLAALATLCTAGEMKP